MPRSRFALLAFLLAVIAPGVVRAQGDIATGDTVEVIDEQIPVKRSSTLVATVGVGDRFQVLRTFEKWVRIETGSGEGWIDRATLREVPMFEIGDLVRLRFGSSELGTDDETAIVNSGDRLLVVRTPAEGRVTVEHEGRVGTIAESQLSEVTISQGTELTKEHGEREQAFRTAVDARRSGEAARHAMRLVAVKRAVLAKVLVETPNDRMLARNIREGIAGFGEFVGGRLRDLEELDSELEMRRLVVAMRRAVGGPADWRTRSAVAEYGYAKELADADPERRDALRAADRAHGAADRMLRAGDVLEATNRLVENVAERKQLLGDDHLLVAVSLNNLAFAHDRLNQPEKAEPLYRESLDIVGRALGEDHPEYAVRLCNLGSMQRRIGKFEAAEPLLAECLAIRDRTLGPTNGATLATVGELASLYDRLERPDRAAELRTRLPKSE